MAQHASNPEITVEWLQSYVDRCRKAYGYDAQEPAFSANTVQYLMDVIEEQKEHLAERKASILFQNGKLVEKDNEIQALKDEIFWMTKRMQS